jgi:UDP-3-O-[3-hydroxymyristoyl] glucosamine N-acyltransferase
MIDLPLSLEEIVKITGAALIGDPKFLISDVADLESATPEDISFLSNPRYEQAMLRSKAGAVFVQSEMNKLPENRNFLLTSDPSLAFQKLIDHLFKDKKQLTGFHGIHPTAVIHPTAEIGKDVTVGPYAVIDQNASIGDGTLILAGCTIGPFVKIGSRCILHSHVIVREHCAIGDRVILQPGAVIGSCGFGYITDKTGRHIKLDQVGNVTIEDDVEIGANATIDRSRFKTTRISRGSKIDNQVQIGHGASIGESNIIVAQTGIAGSSSTGRYVVIGGQAGIAGHLKIGDKVQIAAKSGVSKNLLKGNFGGYPAIPFDEHQRQNVRIRHLARTEEKIKEIEQRIKNLEGESS